MRVVVVTGLSGSGKSTALRALEDLGYYVVDNLPIALLGELIELFRGGDIQIKDLALVADARGAHQLEHVPVVLEEVRAQGHEVELLFLESSDDVIARRFSETRRRHPLAIGHTLEQAIARDRTLLIPLRAAASRILDTGGMSVHDLKREIRALFSETPGPGVNMGVSIVSFGYRHGAPTEANLVFDVRFIPNPYFVETLRPLTGRDPDCAAYVLEQPVTGELLQRIKPLILFALPQYEREGKAYVTIAIGCTGGRHRSVAIAEHLSHWLKEEGYNAHVRHRDTPVKTRSASSLRGPKG